MIVLTPKISVVIPYYKDFENLLKCLNALENQRYPENDFEVIVVNNHPIKSLVLDKIDLKNLTIIDERKPGSYAARNAGIKSAKGYIIAFTDSDCIPEVDWLRNASDIFSKDNDRRIGIIAGQINLFFKKERKALSPTEIYEKYTAFDQKGYSLDGNSVTANWFSYKHVLEEFGGFDSNLKSNGDSELSNRISKKYEVRFAEDVLIWHPARYHTKEIVNKYRRILGGTYQRRFTNDHFGFLRYMLDFSFRRVKFVLKKIVTVKPNESIAIARVSFLIFMGSWKEFFQLLAGEETKR